MTEEKGKQLNGDFGDGGNEEKMNEKRMKEKKMDEKTMKGEKEEELNGMRGDRKTEPALRCQSAPQIHSNPLPPLHTTSTVEDLH